jgi:two-component system chemotaxis response regulator CheB
MSLITRPPIRILIVDDSAFMRTALSRMIASESGFEVAGTACTGTEALSKIAALDPDVVTLDIHMPGLDGVETLRLIMARFPRPVIMVSATTEKDAQNTFNALNAGAFDYIPKRLSSTSLDILHLRDDLIGKIRAAAYSRRPDIREVASRKPPESVNWEPNNTATASAIVAVGSSTGGPKALQEILPLLPRDFPVPLLIVQHMPLGFSGPFARRLNTLCAVTVQEATHHQPILPGVVYIAAAGMHMTVERSSASRTFLRLDQQPQDCLHVPSVDLMMKSVAETFHSLAIGVILTGMGSDGAQGMKAIHHVGGFTIGQDQATCTVYGMPRACAEMGILDRILPISKIPAQIMQATHYRKRA